MKSGISSTEYMKIDRLNMEAMAIQKKLNSGRIMGEKRRRRLQRHLNILLKISIPRLVCRVSGYECDNYLEPTQVS